MQAVQLNVSDEMKALGDALGQLIGDIKAKKSVAQIAADVLPGLLVAVGGMSAMGADIKLVDNQVFLLKSIVGALEPAPAA